MAGKRSGRRMKNSKRRPSTSGLGRAARERDAQDEIKGFLSALVSYADRFAREPHLSFEQHFFRLAAPTGSRRDAKEKRAAAVRASSSPGFALAGSLIGNCSWDELRFESAGLQITSHFRLGAIRADFVIQKNQH